MIMLGANIGTCVTGYMASIGSGKEAMITAYAHIWLNVIGVSAFPTLCQSIRAYSSILHSQ